MIPQICNGSAAHRGTLFSGCRGVAQDACTHTSVWYSAKSSNRWSKYEWKCRRSRAQIGAASPVSNCQDLYCIQIEAQTLREPTWSTFTEPVRPRCVCHKLSSLHPLNKRQRLYIPDHNKPSVHILQGFDLKANKWTGIKNSEGLHTAAFNDSGCQPQKSQSIKKPWDLLLVDMDWFDNYWINHLFMFSRWNG